VPVTDGTGRDAVIALAAAEREAGGMLHTARAVSVAVERSAVHAASRWARGILTWLSTRARRNPPAMLSAVYILLMLTVSVAPQAFTGHDPYALSPKDRLLPPSTSHLFGTDEVGRDIYARVIHGTRLTLTLALFVVALSLALGSVVGSLSGIAPRWVDELIMRTTDIFLAFPQFVMAMAIVSVLSRSMLNAMFALAFIWWAQYARIVRAQVLIVKEEQFVEAATALGKTRLAVLVQEIYPNCFGPVVVRATLDVSYAVLILSGLSFIGLGAEPPTAEWGAILTRSRDYLLGYWWYPTFPGLAIFLTSMAFNFLGDAFRDVLDPRARKLV
jgi:peptide/nickel transport system permease protein